MRSPQEIEAVFLDILQEDSDKSRIRQRLECFYDFDWEALYELSARAYLCPVFYSRLLNLKPTCAPRQLLLKFKNTYILNLKRNLLLKNELLNILGLFEPEGISVIPLKGPVLAEFLYGDLALRQASFDLDLLVRKEHFKDAEGVLGRLGYNGTGECTDKRLRELRLKYDGQLGYFRQADPLGDMFVDLHLDMRGLFAFSSTQDFWNDLQEIDLDGAKVFIPSKKNLLIYLSLVAMAITEFIDLKSIYDVHAFISRYKHELDWQALSGSIKNTAHRACVFFALKLSQDMFRTAIPGDFLKTIRPGKVKVLSLGLWINKNKVLRTCGVRGRSWYYFFTSWHYFAASYLYAKDIPDCIRIIWKKIFPPRVDLAHFSRHSSGEEAPHALYLKRVLRPIMHEFTVRKINNRN